MASQKKVARPAPNQNKKCKQSEKAQTNLENLISNRMADAKLNLRCTNCEGRDFYLQDGLYFCEECNVQFANLVEMEYEERINENFQSQSRIKLAKDKTKEHNLKGKQDLK